MPKADALMVSAPGGRGGIEGRVRASVPANPDAYTHDSEKGRAHPMNTCPTCSAQFAANRIGRPKRFCSDACRREMAHMREELPRLEADLATARRHAAANYGGRAHYWTAHARSLELAIDEHRMRTRGDQ